MKVGSSQELFEGVTVEAIQPTDELPARRGIVVEAPPGGPVTVHYGDAVVTGPAELWRAVGAPLGRREADELRIPWKAAT
jgi:hypothetical protein